MPTTGVYHNTFPNSLEEILWISKKINNLLSQGVSPQDIAVIARKHAHLQEAVKIFHEAQIPINYERDENILEKPFIKQIITILKFINSVNKFGTEAQELLPEILSYSFWRIPNLVIYKISLESVRNRQTWLETIQNFEDPEIRKIADFLRELAKEAINCSAEQVLDEILGVSREIRLPEDESEENGHIFDQNLNYDPEKGILNEIEQSYLDEKKCLTRYISPYKWYYFDSNFAIAKSEYFTFLSSLKVFFTAIRAYNKRSVLTISDILEFVDLMESNNLPLNDKSSFNQQKDTVCLLTAHKAKGLEFEYVFVINCLEKEWNGRKVINKINTPSNLPLLPESENTDDALRLFFVSITRAKSYLCLSSATLEDNSKPLEKLSFLEGITLPQDLECQTEIRNNLDSLKIWLHSSVQNRDLSLEEKAYLKPILENYKLSVTHLNNFLDLSRGGPRLFLEQNLLKFPQSKLVSGSYGTAMHSAIARYYREFNKIRHLPEANILLDFFQDSLADERLNKADFENCLNKGRYYLNIYHKSQKNSFQLTDRIEYDFASQSVVLGNAKITGKIDKMCQLSPYEFRVVDLKTGKAFDEWQVSTQEDKIKLDRYHRQLVFYKLLVENSREFSGRCKVYNGCLEFLEADKKDSLIKILDTPISDEEALQLSRLIQVVYRKIMNFEFELEKPYTLDFQGTQEFIADLLR